ncbi:hypothetical protein K439DRAFT_1622221 [Ramaria rubella]|nr:hypothetical protein K439DRAFT_1622221 [Ramaria rubella]
MTMLSVNVVHWPRIQIDDVHIQFFYQDSGVPPPADKAYTTLVVVHGFGFNGCEDFLDMDRLVSLAKASHIRLVLLNRRAYHGSTPFSDEDMIPRLSEARRRQLPQSRILSAFPIHAIFADSFALQGDDTPTLANINIKAGVLCYEYNMHTAPQLLQHPVDDSIQRRHPPSA